MNKAAVLPLIFLITLSTVQEAATTYLAEEIDGQLVYGTYANQGQTNSVNTLPDFSHAGYKGGGVAIPFIPAVIELTPSGGDDTAAIQTALDQMISIAPMGQNGFRGAVLLKAGTYYVSDTLTMNNSGVILRGEGSNEVGGTKVIFTATTQKNMIEVGFAGSIAEDLNSARSITDSFVPVGEDLFTVSNASNFAVGDTIMVQNLFNQQWIDDLDMAQWGWTTSSYQLRNPRTIIAKYGNVIRIDAPLVQTIEDQYGGGRIYKYSSSSTSSVQNVGIEALRLESTYTSDTDEAHGWSAIRVEKTKNFWIRQVTAVYFGYSCANVGNWCTYGTVEDCAMLDYKSTISGGRRYGFVIDDSCYVLMQRCYTRDGRHDYANGSRVPGPNVFVDTRADNTHADIGPHHRWAMGQLYDNIKGGAMAVQNRTSSGSGHGWSGAQIMFWNCNSTQMICDAPTGAMNWSVGCKGIKTEGSRAPEEPFGIWESHGTHVAPRSLYYTQLRDRLGWSAVRNVIIPQQAAGNIWNELLSWSGNGLFGDDVAVWQTGGSFPDADVRGTVRNLQMLENGITVTWSKFSGPGTVTFTDPAALETTATFSQAGDYVLQILVDDGTSQVTNTLNISARAGGDLTGDGKVDMQDMAELGSKWQDVYDIVTLMNVAEDWLLGIGGIAQEQINIEWVTHDAVWDAPWINLLESQGYTVNSANYDPIDTTALNAADLIIVSRAARGARYDDGTEPIDWSNLTAPLLCLNSNVTDQSDWNWFSSGGTGEYYDKMEVKVPSDPYFAGVTLDVNNQVNILAFGEADTTLDTDPGIGDVLATTEDGRVWIARWDTGIQYWSGSEWGDPPVALYTGGPRVFFAAGVNSNEPGYTDGYNLNGIGQLIFSNIVYEMSGATFDRAPVAGAGDGIANPGVVQLDGFAYD